MIENEKLAFVVSQMGELVKRHGADKAMKILDCCNAIYNATKDFSDDVKEDAIQWVLELARKLEP